ncbi:Multivesicular body subunit 12B, partial [Oryzias melastigma]
IMYPFQPTRTHSIQHGMTAEGAVLLLAQMSKLSEESNQLPTEPITAIGVVTSPSKAPNGYYVVAQTTDGADADLWKDGLFKSKVTRYLCFSKETKPEVVVDIKLIDSKDPLPDFFTAVPETIDTMEAAMRKRRLCVKMMPREAAETAVYDIQITTKSKYQVVNYTCKGEINSMGIWCKMGDVARKLNQRAPAPLPSEAQINPPRRIMSSPLYEQLGGGIYTMTALDDVPFTVSEKFRGKIKEMQQVNLMGITIKSLAEIEEEFHYNFGTERSVAL